MNDRIIESNKKMVVVETEVNSKPLRMHLFFENGEWVLLKKRGDEIIKKRLIGN